MKFMKKITALILILFAFTGISYADIVYTTSDGNLGTIPINSRTEINTPSIQYSGVGADPLVGSYTVETTPYVMVVDRASNNAFGDTALIFSASDLTAPSASVTLTGVHNTKTLAGSYNGRSLFFASDGNTSIVEFDTSSIDIPINMYTYVQDSADEEYEPEFLDMSVGRTYIFALFRATPDKVELFAFDGQIKEGVSKTRRAVIRSDAASLSALASNRYAVGAEEGVSVANINSIRAIVSTDYPVKATCRDKDSGLYFAEQSESGDVYLWHSSYNGDNVKQVASLQGTSDCQLLRHSSYNILAAMTGDSIYLYDMSDDGLLASFSASDLGGRPLNIAESNPEHDDGKSSGSNCSVSCLGAIMIGVTGFALRRKR